MRNTNATLILAGVEYANITATTTAVGCITSSNCDKALPSADGATLPCTEVTLTAVDSDLLNHTLTDFALVSTAQCFGANLLRLG